MTLTFGPSKTVGDSYTIECSPIGHPVPSGGYVMCRNGGITWIVAPESAEVSREKNDRFDAVTTAVAMTNAVTAGSPGNPYGWFLPTVAQLSNPGYTCRTHWDNNAGTYWSCQCLSVNPSYVCWVSLLHPNCCGSTNSLTLCARAFRCVTY
jgi:hypothetical protein